MLKRIHRLPARTRLQNALSYSSPYFSLKIAANEQNTSRFGFIVSKRIAKEATKRNRAKRIVRSCIEELLPTIKPGFNMLFILREADLESKRTVVCDELRALFVKQNLLV